MTLTLDPPRLETERMILRGFEPRDFDAVADFLTDETRAAGFGATTDRHEAWRWFALNIGHWALHGYGYFALELKATGETCGLAGVWNPHGWPEPELGWVAFAAFEGRGLVHEAAQRAREWAYTDLGLTTLTSGIVPGNTRSIALAERMGAVYERTYENAFMGTDMLYRHPSPAALGLAPGGEDTDDDDADGSPEAYA